MPSSNMSASNEYFEQLTGIYKEMYGIYGTSLPSGIATPSQEHVCSSWKLYEGFTEVYEYCSDCDKKRTR